MPKTSDSIVENLTGSTISSLSSLIHNRLTDAARQWNPEMATLMSRIQSATRRPVFMSGSGSTVFLVANSSADAAQVMSIIRKTLHTPAWILEC